jgi:hypothetical protein
MACVHCVRGGQGGLVEVVRLESCADGGRSSRVYGLELLVIGVSSSRRTGGELDSLGIRQYLLYNPYKVEQCGADGACE